MTSQFQQQVAEILAVAVVVGIGSGGMNLVDPPIGSRRGIGMLGVCPGVERTVGCAHRVVTESAPDALLGRRRAKAQQGGRRTGRVGMHLPQRGTASAADKMRAVREGERQNVVVSVKESGTRDVQAEERRGIDVVVLRSPWTTEGRVDATNLSGLGEAAMLVEIPGIVTGRTADRAILTRPHHPEPLLLLAGMAAITGEHLSGEKSQMTGRIGMPSVAAIVAVEVPRRGQGSRVALLRRDRSLVAVEEIAVMVVAMAVEVRAKAASQQPLRHISKWWCCRRRLQAGVAEGVTAVAEVGTERDSAQGPRSLLINTVAVDLLHA